MKFIGNTIEKGMLPLLDVAMMLFGIMIIVLTYSKFDVTDYNKTESDSTTGLTFSIENNTYQIPNPDETLNNGSKDALTENLIRKLNNEGKLIILPFDENGILRHKGNILFDDTFYPDVLELVIENIKKNDPIIIIGYPETKEYNKTTKGRVDRVKAEIEKYTKNVFFLGINKN